jgi:hypothetical protein
LATKAGTVVPRGGLIFGIIVESADVSLSSNKTELDAWITSEDAPNTWVFEAGPTPADGVEGMFNQGRETYPIINLSNMKIESIFHDEAQALAHLSALLP